VSETTEFGITGEKKAMAKIDRMMVGESLVGDGNEVAHIDLLIGPRGSPVESAFANALVNNKDGFTSLLAVVAPNLLTKPSTVMFNKVTIKGAKQAVQMFGPAQRAVAMAVADSVQDGTIPANEADNLFICVGVFIHWLAADDRTTTTARRARRSSVPWSARRRRPKCSPRRAARRIRSRPLEPGRRGAPASSQSFLGCG
jgi:5,6,7,8-tetrahydromethanopterin hydro-lyase